MRSEICNWMVKDWFIKVRFMPRTINRTVDIVAEEMNTKWG